MRIVSATAKSHHEIGLASRGLISESLPIGAVANSGIPTANAASGTVVSSIVPLRSGDLVTNLLCEVAVVGISLSFAKLALYDSTGIFIAATGSVSASFNSGTGYKVIALTTAYSVTADGGYHVGFVQYGAGATGATLARGSTLSIGSAIGTGAVLASAVTNQTDLVGNITLAASGNYYWFGVS